MSGTRDTGPRGPSATDLMATRPAGGAAAPEALTDGIARLGDAVAALEAAAVTREDLADLESRIREHVRAGAAEGPGPVTRADLDGLGDSLAGRVEAAVAGQAGPDSPPPLVAAHAARVQVAAEAVEAELRKTRGTLGPLPERLSRQLAGDREATLDVVTRSMDVAQGTRADVDALREEARAGLDAISTRLSALHRRTEAARSRRPPVLWSLAVFVAGMALEGRFHYASSLFRWLGS